MRIHIANPNATRRMTDTIAAVARRVAGQGVEVIATTNDGGPAAIQGPIDGALSVPGLLEAIGSTRADAHVIACFDDTGLDAARHVTDAPVVGIGEAGCLAATQLARRFVVVTSAAISVPVISDNLIRNGLMARCADVRAAGVGVLDIGRHGGQADPVEAAARQAAEDYPGAAIVLGCAGMALLAARLSSELGRPVVDGVAAGTGLAMTLIGVRTASA